MSTMQGFAHDMGDPGMLAPRARPVAVVNLIATVGLALSTLIAVMAVSIGIARADTLGLHADGDAAALAVALLVGLLLSAMGGFTAAVTGSAGRRA